MFPGMNRRDWLRALGVSGLAAGISQVKGPTALGQNPGESSGFQSSIVRENEIQANRASPSIVDGKVIQPARELPVLHTTDVLVVGGGPAGVTAAIAAQRAGAKVTLVERYGHFGGLWTGGLVLLVIGHIVKGGKQVCQGIGEEMMRRLDKMDGAIMDRRPGVAPTVDAEAVKYLMVEMIEEAGVKVFLHCWGVDAIVNGDRPGRRVREQVRAAGDLGQDRGGCDGGRRCVRRRRRGIRAAIPQRGSRDARSAIWTVWMPPRQRRSPSRGTSVARPRCPASTG